MIEDCRLMIGKTNLTIDGGHELDSEELKKRTKEFAHRCVKLAVALPKSALGNHIK